MNLSRLEKASTYEVNDWLKDKLKLTDYQCELLRDREIVRFSPFEFYKFKEVEKVSFLWRLTLIFVLPYFILLFVWMPIQYMITNEWGYSQNFQDKFHRPWMRKLGL